MTSLITPTFLFSPMSIKATPLASNLFSLASKSNLFSKTQTPIYSLPLKRIMISLEPSNFLIQTRCVHSKSSLSTSGEIHVIVGPMFAGKTTTLLHRIQAEINDGRWIDGVVGTLKGGSLAMFFGLKECDYHGNVAIIKSNKDNRYGLDSVATHDGVKLPCFALPNLSSFRQKFGQDAYDQLDVIGIDEAQFFEDLYDFCREVADHDGKTVIVAGLDGDYLRRSFGSVLDIIPLADSVTKLSARCEICGKRAFFTLRKTEETQTELIGGADVYMPVCRQHYVSGQVAVEAARMVLGSQKDCTYSLDLLKGENLYCDECGILNICNQEKKKGFKPQMFLLLLFVDDENVWNDQVKMFLLLLYVDDENAWNDQVQASCLLNSTSASVSETEHHLIFSFLSSCLSIKGPKLAPVSKTLQIFIKTQSLSPFPSAFVRKFSGFNSKDNESAHETEWERLLKPFDLKELRRSFNKITPFQLCKLLELPLDVETSMEIFKWAGAQKGYCHSFRVYYLLIDKLGAAAGFKVIDRLLLQMKEEGIVFRESLFILIMKYYGRAGLPGQATRLLLDMKGVYCCEPSFRSYNVVLDVLVVGNCPSVASNVFYDMLSKGVSPNDYTFGLVMKALCMVNEVDNACLLFRDMTKHGCVPNSMIYQTLIDALSKRDRVDEALKLLEEMFLMGCQPDVNTFNTVIYGFCRLNRVLEGAKLVDRMILKGFTPDDMTYGYLMHGLCKTGRIDEAQALLSKVPGPNVVHFNTLVNGFVRNGRLNEATAFVYDKMINNGYVPDVFTFSTLVNGLCKKGLLGSALELVNDMDAKGCKPNLNTYTILIDGFCKKGQLEEAGLILREMLTKGLSLNTVGYNALISALCKHRKVHEALDMFGEMSSKGCKPDIFTFNSLIFGLCRVDEMEDALALYRDMVLEGVIANSVTFNTLIHAFLRRGEIQEALKLVNDMLFRGCPLDEITYNGLIKALCKTGAVEKGLGLFEEMIRKGLTPSIITCNILINGFCTAGKVHNALEFMRDMIHRGFSPDIVTYNSLINGLCKRGRIQEALNLFEKLQAEGIQPDSITYNTLICWLCREGAFDDACFLLYRGVENGFVPSDVTWNILVYNFGKQSNSECQTITYAQFSTPDEILGTIVGQLERAETFEHSKSKLVRHYSLEWASYSDAHELFLADSTGSEDAREAQMPMVSRIAGQGTSAIEASHTQFSMRMLPIQTLKC
ncbi:hypothetical protein POTOM_022381 [Populus tomentosa]|uniref:thymidine kinase n=1 Tax=Populus tomentosa TaxID=118781 RepID=A0A8X8CYJ2_POPTO|nr:hypothetical protein POTOM_022381 [Populus tomentosa]